MAVSQVVLNEISDIIWETNSWNESGQGQMDKLGGKVVQQKELFLKNQ